MPAAIEYLDAGALAAAAGAFPAQLDPAAAFIVIAEADGTELEARAAAVELRAALEPDALDALGADGAREVAGPVALARGLSLAVAAQRGGKVSEDIAVPVDRLGEAIERTLEIGRAHALPACSWGHAGDGNLHSTFMIDAADAADSATGPTPRRHDLHAPRDRARWHDLRRARRRLAQARRARAAARERALELHHGIKELFDPLGIMNPGKKI